MFKSLSKVLAMVPDKKERKRKRRRKTAPKPAARAKPAAPISPPKNAPETPETQANLEDKLADAGAAAHQPGTEAGSATGEPAPPAAQDDRAKLIADAIDIHDRQSKALAKLLDSMGDETREKLRRMAMEQVFLDALKRANPSRGNDDE